jgi:hypothetical protein
MDSTSTTGGAKTGLTFSSSGLIISTIADNESTATAYTQAGSTTETITTLGTFAAPTATKCRFKEVDATNHPGLYEIQIADARWAVSNARSVIVTVSGATGAAQVDAEIQLPAVDFQDTVRMGLTALPNAAAEASGGLYTRGTGAGQINQDANGRIDANVKTWIGGTIPAVTTTGVPKVDVANWTGTAVATPATAGVAEVNVKNINNVATTSVTTVSANQGTTQPVNFTGTAGSALVKGDMVDVAGAAVSATTAQIGVNVVNWNNTVVATPATAGIPDINVKNINNVAAATPGASGGILISGSNSGTTTLGAFTVTGATTLTGAVSLGSTLGVTGTTTLAAVTTTGTVTCNALTVTNATTLSGAVSFGSTFGITGTTTLAALTTTGTVTFNAFTVTNATNLTGAVTFGSTWGITGAATFTAGIVTNITGNLSGSVGSLTTNNDKTGYSLTVTPPTAATTAAAVWDVVLSGHLTSGTTGAALNAAGSAGDPWATAIPGAYGAGTAGHRLGNIPDVAAGAAGGLFIAGTNAATTVTITGSLSGTVGGIAGTTQTLDALQTALNSTHGAGSWATATGFSVAGDAMTLTSGERTAVAAAVTTVALTESYAADGAAFTLAQGLYQIYSAVMEFSISGTALSCQKLDGSTTWATVTLDSASAPTSRTRTA